MRPTKKMQNAVLWIEVIGGAVAVVVFFWFKYSN